MRLYTRRT